MKLSDKEHWDAIHVFESETVEPVQKNGVSPHDEQSRVQLFKLWLKKKLGDSMLEKMSAYDSFLLWDVIFKQHLPDLSGARAVEIGSAPGDFMVKFSQRYNCVPYGIEYSETGVELNRKIFADNDLNPENVLHTDFFAEEFQGQHREFFDVVISRGFIEHFSDVDDVVQKHLDLLKPNGFLIVEVPNLTGVNYLLTGLVNRDILPLHNLDIMRKQRFDQLFENKSVRKIASRYYGTFSFFLFYGAIGGFWRAPVALTHKMQPVLNLIFRQILGDKSVESRFSSPSLLFIGKKV